MCLDWLVHKLNPATSSTKIDTLRLTSLVIRTDPSLNMEVEREELMQKIKNQGDVVRKLKDQKVDKAKVKAGNWMLKSTSRA